MARFFTSCGEERQVRGVPQIHFSAGETEAARTKDWWYKGK